MRTRLTPHFFLDEMLPVGYVERDLDLPTLTNLEALAANILEPVRLAMGGPIQVTSGYRPGHVNAAVGGKPQSDHLTGNAADWFAHGAGGKSWQVTTIEAFLWIREHLAGRFGQLILEDHRQHYNSPTKLWVHVSNPTSHHPGTGPDVNRVLLSWNPSSYAPFAADLIPKE